MQRVVLCLTVSLALVFSASLGASVASADRCGAYSWSCEEKKVERFVKRQAKLVAPDQPALFPHARITSRKVSGGCSPIGRRFLERKWSCSGFISLYERSTIDPPAVYDPEWPIRQRTVRSCRWGFGGAERLYVRYKRGRPRGFLGGWRMDCALGEFEINLWNKYGPDYQPNSTEPTPYEVVDARIRALTRPRDDLLPAPSGGPGGPPPGPISRQGGSGITSSARAATHIFQGCSSWNQQNWNGRWYWVQGCFWNVDLHPGVLPGIFAQDSYYYELYYHVGNDYYGRPITRLFQSGTG